MSNLLLKISVLEHASALNKCRLGEDILTVICDPPASPPPTNTPTVTPTNTATPAITPTPTPTKIPSIILNGELTIPLSPNYISGNGLTFVGSAGDKIEYAIQTGSDLPATMNILVSGVVRSSVLFPLSIYNGKPFKFTLNSNSTSYTGNFISGNINFS